jgi:hypothetical protein
MNIATAFVIALFAFPIAASDSWETVPVQIVSWHEMLALLECDGTQLNQCYQIVLARLRADTSHDDSGTFVLVYYRYDPEDQPDWREVSRGSIRSLQIRRNSECDAELKDFTMKINPVDGPCEWVSAFVVDEEVQGQLPAGRLPCYDGQHSDAP